MRGTKIVVTVVGAFALLAPALALGGSVTFTDPDDFEVAPDVHATSKTSYVSETRGARVRIGVRGELGPDFRVRVYVDSRRGPRPDYVMVADVRDLELRSCSVRDRRSGETVPASCNGNIDRVWWDVARRRLQPDKTIRWRIVGLGWPTYREVTDRAPDAGFYP